MRSFRARTPLGWSCTRMDYGITMLKCGMSWTWETDTNRPIVHRNRKWGARVVLGVVLEHVRRIMLEHRSLWNTSSAKSVWSRSPTAICGSFWNTIPFLPEFSIVRPFFQKSHQSASSSRFFHRVASVFKHEFNMNWVQHRQTTLISSSSWRPAGDLRKSAHDTGHLHPSFLAPSLLPSFRKQKNTWNNQNLPKMGNFFNQVGSCSTQLSVT